MGCLTSLVRGPPVMIYPPLLPRQDKSGAGIIMGGPFYFSGTSTCQPGQNGVSSAFAKTDFEINSVYGKISSIIMS